MKKKLIGLALAVGLGALVAKVAGAKKAEWQGLNEAQVREKVGQQMPSRVPDEKRDAVADKVVTKMRERGMLVEDEAAESPDPEPSAEPAEADESEADETEETAGS